MNNPKDTFTRKLTVSGGLQAMLENVFDGLVHLSTRPYIKVGYNCCKNLILICQLILVSKIHFLE